MERREVDGVIEWRDGFGAEWTALTQPLANQGAEMLGLIAYWAAWLEHAISQSCMMMSDHPDVAEPLVSDVHRMKSSDIVNAMRKLVSRSADPDDLALSVLEQATDALVARNKMLHSVILGNDANGRSAVFHPRYPDAIDTVDQADLFAIAQRLFDACMSVMSIDWSRVGLAVSTR
ncbi:hypothetical protein [Microbacterium gorillae]|uniref:hypothetical protein n=1 Tax=Microbacterium gorillae TaxID=1231063 RepID=UPI00058FFA51|nr:hypothetical protein [Microbacterium gorillae]